MPLWKKSTVSSRSSSVKKRRLASPVLPDVRRVTMRAMSSCGTARKENGEAAISDGVVNGTRPISERLSRGASGSPARLRR